VLAAAATVVAGAATVIAGTAREVRVAKEAAKPIQP